MGYYVKNYLTFTVLCEVHVQLPTMKLFEIQNSRGHNIICGVIYRHPNDNLDSFLEYINSIAERIDRGSKYCAVISMLIFSKLKSINKLMIF